MCCNKEVDNNKTNTKEKSNGKHHLENKVISSYKLINSVIHLLKPFILLCILELNFYQKRNIYRVSQSHVTYLKTESKKDKKRLENMLQDFLFQIKTRNINLREDIITLYSVTLRCIKISFLLLTSI